MPLDFIMHPPGFDPRKPYGDTVMWENNTGKRLYLNEDKTQVVLESSPHASFVLCGPNARIPMEDAVRYGLIAKDDVPKTEQPDFPEALSEPDSEVLAARQEKEEEEMVEEEEGGLTINTEEPPDKEVTLGEGSKAVQQSEASDKAQRSSSSTRK